MKKIPSLLVPIIDNNQILTKNLFELLKNKKVVIFGVPGAFTPTCSDYHLPGFIELSDEIKNKGIDDIFCLSVNDQFVMQYWLSNYSNANKIKAIADGNADVCKILELTSDKTKNFMGLRSQRFAMLVKDNFIKEIYIDEPGNFKKTSARFILNKI